MGELSTDLKFCRKGGGWERGGEKALRRRTGGSLEFRVKKCMIAEMTIFLRSLVMKGSKGGKRKGMDLVGEQGMSSEEHVDDTVGEELLEEVPWGGKQWDSQQQ